MNFKSLFLFFNLVLVFSFGLVFFLPWLFGPGLAGAFWLQYWYLGLLFLLLLGGLDLYFLKKWRTLDLLDRQAWPELAEYLKSRLFKPGDSPRSGDLQLYAQTLLVLHRLDELSSLAEHWQTHSPKLWRRHRVLLGLPLLMAPEGSRLSTWFGEAASDPLALDRSWAAWCEAFGWMLRKEPVQALDRLRSLSAKKENSVLTLLSAYLLAAIDPAAGQAVAPRLRKQSPDQWQKALRQAREKNVLLLILNTLIDQALDWLFSNSQEGTDAVHSKVSQA